MTRRRSRSRSVFRALAVMLAAGTLPLAGVAVPATASAFRSTAVLVPAGEGPAALERMRRAVGSPGDNAAKTCWKQVSITADANGNYVTVELDYDALLENALRAAAATAGTRESFSVCRNDVTGYTTFQSEANNLYVSAEFDYNGDYRGTLRARAGSVHSWEGYYTSAAPGQGPFTIKIPLESGGSRFVTTEVGMTGIRYGVLRADATSTGQTEAFHW